MRKALDTLVGVLAFLVVVHRFYFHGAPLLREGWQTGRYVRWLEALVFLV